MGLYNDLIVNDVCPCCNAMTEMYFQVHTANSANGIGGRFALRKYRLGDTLAWWPKSDKRFCEWFDWSATEVGDYCDRSSNTVVEGVYGNCYTCNSDLRARLTIIELKLTALDEIRKDPT